MHERERELLASTRSSSAPRATRWAARKGAADACRSAGAAEGVLRTAAEQQSHRAQRAEAREAALQLEVQRLQEVNAQLHDSVKAAASAAAEEAAAGERRTLLHIHLLRSALSEADVDARRLRHDHERLRVAARAAADAEAADTAMAARIAEVERAAAREGRKGRGRGGGGGHTADLEALIREQEQAYEAATLAAAAAASELAAERTSAIVNSAVLLDELTELDDNIVSALAAAAATPGGMPSRSALSSRRLSYCSLMSPPAARHRRRPHHRRRLLRRLAGFRKTSRRPSFVTAMMAAQNETHWGRTAAHTLRRGAGAGGVAPAAEAPAGRRRPLNRKRCATLDAAQASLVEVQEAYEQERRAAEAEHDATVHL